LRHDGGPTIFAGKPPLSGLVGIIAIVQRLERGDLVHAGVDVFAAFEDQAAPTVSDVAELGFYPFASEP
jgi:hypothetical protein